MFGAPLDSRVLESRACARVLPALSYLPKFETTRGPMFLLSSRLLYATNFGNLAENRSLWPSWTLTWSKSISPYNLFFLRIQILNKAS